MKFLVRSRQNVFGMAYSRREILDNAYNRSKGIKEHILKCVIYSSRYKDYNHWIEEEIATWIFNVLDMKVKKGSNVKTKDYLNALFDSFGDELEDAKRELIEFHKVFVEKHPDPYPDFEITRSLYSTYFHGWNELKSNLRSYLNEHKKNYSKSDIIRVVHRSLDPYCM